MRHWLLLLIFIIQQPCFGADAKELNEAHQRGGVALSKGEYRVAKENYAKVIDLAREQKMPKQLLGELLFQAAQVFALACDFQNSEAMFKESLEIAELETKYNGESENRKRTANFSLKGRLFELAHFYSDRGLYGQSFMYWSRFIPLHEEYIASLNTAFYARDPIGYSMMLREYGKSLSATGNESLAKAMLDKATDVAERNAELFPRVDWFRYGYNCK